MERETVNHLEDDNKTTTTTTANDNEIIIIMTMKHFSKECKKTLYIIKLFIENVQNEQKLYI